MKFFSNVDMVKIDYPKVVEGIEWKKDEDPLSSYAFLSIVPIDFSPTATTRLYNPFDGII